MGIVEREGDECDGEVAPGELLWDEPDEPQHTGAEELCAELTADVDAGLARATGTLVVQAAADDDPAEV